MADPRPRSRLARREQQAVALVAEGCTDNEIAERLGITLSTASDTVSRAAQVLGARGRANLVSLAYQTLHLVVAARRPPARGDGPDGHWTQRAREPLNAVVDRDGRTVTTPVDRRWLWRLETALAVSARPGDVLDDLRKDLAQYLAETCEHHWLHCAGGGYVPEHEQCMWCHKIQTTAVGGAG